MLRMSVHIHLFPKDKSKSCKIARKWKKSQTIEIQWYFKEKWNKAWQMFAIALEKAKKIKSE